MVMLSLAGCSKAAAQESSAVKVFLSNDVTDDQRNTVNLSLHAMPSVRDISFKTRQQAYEEFKQQFKDAPDLVAATAPDALPESFKATVTDGSFIDAIETVLVALPGVDRVVVVPVTTGSPQTTEGMVVQVRKDLTGDQRAAIERAILAVPQAKPARFESADAAYTRLRKKCQGQPGLARALDPASALASYRFELSLVSPGGSTPSVSLTRLGGVEEVLTVPVSAL
jgi:cell division protein FtsX